LKLKACHLSHRQNLLCFIFPHQLTITSALLGETENPEIASFHFNAALRFYQKKT